MLLASEPLHYQGTLLDESNPSSGKAKLQVHCSVHPPRQCLPLRVGEQSYISQACTAEAGPLVLGGRLGLVRHARGRQGPVLAPQCMLLGGSAFGALDQPGVLLRR